MATTTGGLRYPTGPDVPDVPFWNQALANDVDRNQFTIAFAQRASSATVATTGNVWLGDLVSTYKNGNIDIGPGGVVIYTAGLYVITAWSRQSSTAANTTFQTNIGMASAVRSTAYQFAATAGTNVTPVANDFVALTAGQVIQWGYSQAVASSITFHGTGTYNGLLVRLVKG